MEVDAMENCILPLEMIFMICQKSWEIAPWKFVCRIIYDYVINHMSDRFETRISAVDFLCWMMQQEKSLMHHSIISSMNMCIYMNDRPLHTGDVVQKMEKAMHTEAKFSKYRTHAFLPNLRCLTIKKGNDEYYCEGYDYNKEPKTARVLLECIRSPKLKIMNIYFALRIRLNYVDFSHILKHILPEHLPLHTNIMESFDLVDLYLADGNLRTQNKFQDIIKECPEVKNMTIDLRYLDIDLGWYFTNGIKQGTIDSEKQDILPFSLSTQNDFTKSSGIPTFMYDTRINLRFDCVESIDVEMEHIFEKNRQEDTKLNIGYLNYLKNVLPNLRNISYVITLRHKKNPKLRWDEGSPGYEFVRLVNKYSEYFINNNIKVFLHCVKDLNTLILRDMSPRNKKTIRDQYEYLAQQDLGICKTYMSPEFRKWCGF